MDPPHPPPIVHSIYPSKDPSFSSPPIISPACPFLGSHYGSRHIPRFPLYTPPSSNPNPSLQIFRAFNKLKKARGWTVVQRKRGGENTEGEAGSEVNRAGDQGGERRRGGIRRVARKVEGNSFLELAIILIAFLNGTVRCCCSATRAATRASLPFVLTFLHPLLLPLSSV